MIKNNALPTIGFYGYSKSGKTSLTLHHPNDPSKYQELMIKDLTSIEPLPVEIIKDGKITYNTPSLADIRDLRQQDLDKLYPGVKRIMNPHHYHVSLTDDLWKLKKSLMAKYENGQ